MLVILVAAAALLATWHFWPRSAATPEAIKRHEAAVEATKQAESSVDKKTAKVMKRWAETDEKLATAHTEAHKAMAGMDTVQLVNALRNELAIIRDERKRRNMADAGRQRSYEPSGGGRHIGGAENAASRAGYIDTVAPNRTGRDIGTNKNGQRIQTTGPGGEDGVSGSAGGNDEAAEDRTSQGEPQRDYWSGGSYFGDSAITTRSKVVF